MRAILWIQCRLPSVATENLPALNCVSETLHLMDCSSEKLCLFSFDIKSHTLLWIILFFMQVENGGGLLLVWMLRGWVFLAKSSIYLVSMKQYLAIKNQIKIKTIINIIFAHSSVETLSLMVSDKKSKISPRTYTNTHPTFTAWARKDLIDVSFSALWKFDWSIVFFF